MIRSIRILSLLLLAALVGPTLHAQVPTGTPAFGSFGGGPDVINLANLNVHWTIPVLHKPGRGTNFNYDLTYDSSIWYPVTSGSTTSWQLVSSSSLPGWQASQNGQSFVGYVMTYSSSQCTNNGSNWYQITTWSYGGFYYNDQFGVRHNFSTLGWQYITNSGYGYCGPKPGFYPSNPPTSQLATDGSGLTMYVTPSTGGAVSPSLTTSNGTKFTPPVVLGATSGSLSTTDRNGNMLSVDSSGHFYDTLSTTTPVLSVAGTAPSNTTFTYTASSGAGTSYTMKYTTYKVQTHFGCSNITEYGGANGISTSLVSEIDLPDGSKYTFGYESTLGGASGAVTGRLASVTLPTGGAISYTYLGGDGSHNGITCADGSASGLKRFTPDTGSNYWNYTRTAGSGAAYTTTVTDPASNQTAIQFQGIYETQRKVYQGSIGGTLLQTINTCYNAATSPCTGTAITLPITQRTVNATIPGSGNLQSQHTDKFDSYGNTTESDDYDLATAAPFPLIRQTLISYAALGGYLNAFKQTVKVLDGSGNIKSRQDTSYDQYSSFGGANCITGAPNHDDAGHGCSFTARGNVTSVTAYTDPVTPGGAIAKSFTFDSLGNRRTAQLNCCQLKTFNYSATTEYAYPDSVVSGSSSPQLTTQATYDLHMGLTLTTTDPNNVQTTYTYDNMGRPLTSQVGTLPATNYTYADSGTWSVKVCSPVQGTNTICQKTILDSQGRAVTAQILDGNGTLYSASDTQYDSFGRAYETSNPYTGSPSYWTRLGFDVLGRTTSTTLPDNSVNSVSYTDNTVTTTDPAGKQLKSVLDGLGRLTSVYEPDPSNGNTLTLQTSYTYNVSGQLTGVTQGAQTRTNGYDALGRVVSVTTPEAGTVCYGTYSGSTCQANGYDSFNNLLYRTDARGVVASYLYDDLNRLVGITYPTVPSGVAAMPNVCKVNGAPSNNANVCYVYGTTPASYNNGRIVSMTDPSGSESYTYDQFGNVTQLAKVIGANTYTTKYSYNLASQLTQITYPSGRIVQQSVDAVGRLCEIAPSTTGCGTAASPFATGFAYNAANGVTGLKYGNGIFASFGFSSDRLALNCLDYSTTNRSGTCTHDSTTKFGLGYSYQTAPSNNGQIAGITDYVDSGRSATYTYDSLYRLTIAVTTGSTNFPAWGLSETYDRYGNRSAQGTYSGCTGITCPTNSVTTTAATNHIYGSPYSYDASGNMTNDGQNTLVYDGENRAVSATVTGSSSGTYTYDGKGLRIQKVSVISGSGTTTTVYAFSSGKVIAEYDNGALPSTPTREYVYAGGKLLAKIDTSGTKYYHQDHLSNRLVTDSSGNTVAQVGHFPFGESWYNVTKDKLIFTSYERDAESGNDYAKARYYISRLARFSSPDPVTGNPSNPQSWNRYSYVLNDPINLNDPEGEYCQYMDDSGEVVEEVDYDSDTSECAQNGGNWVPDDKGGSGMDDETGEPPSAFDPNQSPDPGVDLEALDLCTSELFGVSAISFSPANGRDSDGTPGTETNGSFTGAMAGIYEGPGQPLGVGPSVFTVTTDVSKSVGQVTASYNLAIQLWNQTHPQYPQPLQPQGSVAGYTSSEFPLSNNVGWNAADVFRGVTVVGVQIWELGNSLGFMTGRQPNAADFNSQPGPGNNEAGGRLQNCYNSYTFN